MLYSLYYKDNEALRFDFDESYIEVVNNQYLPYSLRDYIKTSGQKDFKGSLHDIEVLRDYLATRTLNLSRENAKTILNVVALPQSLNTEQKLKIVMACNGLSMQDNFWIKPDGKETSFDEMCLRHNKLADVSYDIAILGRHVSATADELAPDLTTEGMFPKYWHRNSDGDVELWKTDKMGGKVNSECEICSSDILDSIGYNHVRYRREERDGKIFSVCKCMADDEYSFITMQEIMDWHVHTGHKFPEKIQKMYDREFPNMCVVDYVLANTDRHSGNWGVIADSGNRIIGFAPMFDMNQALVADEFGTDISDLIYEPTGLSFKESIKKWGPSSTVDFLKADNLSDKVRERAEIIEKYRNKGVGKDRTKVDDPLIQDIDAQYKRKQEALYNSDKTMVDE